MAEKHVSKHKKTKQKNQLKRIPASIIGYQKRQKRSKASKNEYREIGEENKSKQKNNRTEFQKIEEENRSKNKDFEMKVSSKTSKLVKTYLFGLPQRFNEPQYVLSQPLDYGSMKSHTSALMLQIISLFFTTRR